MACSRFRNAGKDGLRHAVFVGRHCRQACGRRRALMREYAATSFLVSLHVADVNTLAASAHTKSWKQPHLLAFTPFSAFELNNTLCRVLPAKSDLALAAKRISRRRRRGNLCGEPVAGLSPHRRGRQRLTVGSRQASRSRARCTALGERSHPRRAGAAFVRQGAASGRSRSGLGSCTLTGCGAVLVRHSFPLAPMALIPSRKHSGPKVRFGKPLRGIACRRWPRPKASPDRGEPPPPETRAH
jgi:hypothetical protein